MLQVFEFFFGKMKAGKDFYSRKIIPLVERGLDLIEGADGSKKDSLNSHCGYLNKGYPNLNQRE